MLEYLYRAVKDKKIKVLNKFKTGAMVISWNPSEDETELLTKNFGLDKEEIEAGLDENEIPRIEKHNNKLLIYTKYIKGDKLETVLLEIGKNFFLVLAKYKIPVIDEIKNMKIKVYTTQRYKLLLRILEYITEQFEKKNLELAKRVSKWKSLSDVNDKELTKLLKDENILTDLVSAYQYMRLTYERLYSMIDWFESDKELLDDLIIEIKQGYEMSKSSLKAISSLREYYLIMLSNRLNRIITILTVFTIFIDIIAAISGFYGMNIPLPMQGDKNAFLVIILVILAIWTGMLIYVKKSKIF